MLSKIFKSEPASYSNISSLLRFNIKKYKTNLHQIFNPEKEFTRRIHKRYYIFWEGTKLIKQELPLLKASDGWETWRSYPIWQRILNNKSNSREFAKKLGCKVPDLYWKGNAPDNIKFDQFPRNYVVRPTLGTNSRMVFLIKNGINLFDGLAYSPNDIIGKIKKANQENVPQDYLVEEFLPRENGEIAIHDDFKFYMFNGEIACIQLINRFSPKSGTVRYYNEDWQILPNLKKSSYEEGVYQDPPHCFEEMKSFAKILSKAYVLFVRIDFYATGKGAVFGEFAATPSHGIGYTPSGSKYLINYWNKYCKGMI